VNDLDRLGLMIDNAVSRVFGEPRASAYMAVDAVRRWASLEPFASVYSSEKAADALPFAYLRGQLAVEAYRRAYPRPARSFWGSIMCAVFGHWAPFSSIQWVAEPHRMRFIEVTCSRCGATGPCAVLGAQPSDDEVTRQALVSNATRSSVRSFGDTVCK
jgi:hypothetical protein